MNLDLGTRWRYVRMLAERIETENNEFNTFIQELNRSK
jgi:hypothetical protein